MRDVSAHDRRRATFIGYGHMSGERIKDPNGGVRIV